MLTDVLGELTASIMEVMQKPPLKRRSISARLNGAAFQQSATFILVAVRTSNPT
jgi:hypothetical protein